MNTLDLLAKRAAQIAEAQAALPLDSVFRLPADELVKLTGRRKLLATNAKLLKTPDNQPVMVAGLTISPHGIGGFDVCKNAGWCRISCVLRESGRTQMDGVRSAQDWSKALLIAAPAVFYTRLERELYAFGERCRRLDCRALVRLNVASDLDYLSTIRKFPGISYYDYSKVTERVEGSLPANYQITYSRSERSSESRMQKLLSRGINIAAVFDTPYYPQCGVVGRLPETYLGVRVVDGDLHDWRLREFDGAGVVVGLRLKGNNAAKQSARDHGFSVPTIYSGMMPSQYRAAISAGVN